MKIKIIPFILIILNLSCSQHKKSNNQFELTDDTLIINCTRQKGDGLFTLGLIQSDLKDTTTNFHNSVVYPKQLTRIKRDQIITDLWAANPYYIDLIIGKHGTKDVFVLDENSNQDLHDDSVRILKPINRNNEDDLVKCKFFRSHDSETITDSSWIRIGETNNSICYGKSEHLIADFMIGINSYKVGVIDSRTICFKYRVFPEIAIIKQNDVEKDTLYEKDILKIGEYLCLDSTYYRFDSVNENGYNLTLIKEKNFKETIGTQIGMLAPDFFCKTVSGDTIVSSDLHDKILIIANSCGCGGDTVSTKAFYDIMDLFGDKIRIIRLDTKIENGTIGLQVDTNEMFNKDFYEKYRNMYCSRTCFVISKSNRIIDKFPLSDWKSNLSMNIAE